VPESGSAPWLDNLSLMMGSDGEPARAADRERVAVGSRPRSQFGADDAGGARAVIHDGRLAEQLALLLGEGTRDDVAAAAGGKTDDQPHRLDRVRLLRAGSACKERQGQREKRRRNQMKRQMSTDNFKNKI